MRLKVCMTHSNHWANHVQIKELKCLHIKLESFVYMIRFLKYSRVKYDKI